jgi:hypothetical protein
MQAGMASAPTLGGMPAGAIVIEPRTYVPAIRATVTEGPLAPWHADQPTGGFPRDHHLSTGGSGILSQRAAAGTGEPQR